ncbi:MAG TPA: type II toxin-antitoxin system PemK/MazF family toxin [Bacillales bacterium]
MSSYSIGEIYSVEVAYQEGDGRKKERPIVIVDIEKNPTVLIAAPMTGTPPKDPPKHYDLYKIPVHDWQQAGLKKIVIY